MKILLVGANSDYAIERFYLKYLNTFDNIVAELFEAQNIFLAFYCRNVINKLLFRLGFKNIYEYINKAFIREIQKSENPDVVLVFKGMEIFPKTIDWLKTRGIKVINYNPDNPFIFSGRGSGNSNVTRSLDKYDLHFSYNLQIKNQIEQQYNIKTHWLPFGFEVEEKLFKSVRSIPEVIKTAFVGNPDRPRAAFLTKLAAKGIHIDVYGNNWRRFVKHPNITLYPPVYGDSLWETLYRYRVQLNPLRIHNHDSHGMRSFEVPGIGGIMLAPRTSEHLQFFEDGKEAFFYENVHEATLCIEHLLSLPNEKANKIRKAARERSLASGYTYQDRAQFVYKILQTLET